MVFTGSSLLQIDFSVADLSRRCVFYTLQGLSFREYPEKVYLDNTNLMYALSSSADIGNIRETFFANQLKQNHQIAFSGQGDFWIDDIYTFEVGGKNKTFEQIKDVPNSYLIIDGIEYGTGNRIPLWLFGFLY